jgi:DNA-binding MarR family transcriptional regulator
MSEEEAALAREFVEELFDLGAAIDRVGRMTAGRLGINQTDLICLDLLHRRGPLSAGEVAAALGLTTAAISAMATRLERGGYARREMDPGDRRRVLLHAEPHGVQQVYGLFGGLYAAAAGLSAGEPEVDLRRLLALMRRFRTVIAETATYIGESGRSDR